MVQVQRQLFTVAEYYKMAEVGILKPTDKIELINGEIIQMSPIKSPHANTVSVVEELLYEQLIKKVTIRTQSPISISNHSEPEPDIAIVKYGRNRYANSHPNPLDVFLLIEVSDSTLKFDRKTKKKLYAKAEIPEYWIINIPDSQIEVFRKPIDGVYQKELIVKNEETIKAEKIKFKISVSDIFFE